MASLNKKEELSISLFPMFNILVSTLGVLIFIMSTISILSLGKGKALKIIKEKLQGEHAKQPHYFIWDGVALIALEKKDTVTFDMNLKRDFGTFEASHEYISKKIQDTETGKLIQEIKSHNGTEYIIVLVRASGFQTFHDIHQFIKSEGIDIGYEPVDNDSKIKL